MIERECLGAFFVVVEVFYPGSVEGPPGSVVQENHQPDEDDEDVETLLSE